MYVVMCLSLALVLALYIGLMKRLSVKRKQRINEMQRRAAKIARKSEQQFQQSDQKEKD